MAEVGGGLLVASGLLTPLGTAALIGMMAAAVAYVHLSKGFFAHNGGLEFPASLGLGAVTIALTGPGRYSLDHHLGWAWASHWWSYGAIGLGLAACATVGVGGWGYSAWARRHQDAPGRSTGHQEPVVRRAA